MATIKAEATFNLKPIQDLINIFPNLGGRYLALVGKRARTVLKEEFLSGQEITLRAFPKDARGRNTITSDVNKKRTQVKIYSYPANLFEKKRTFRDGSTAPGKFIITKKLKQVVMARQAGYITEFENRILEPEIKKAGL